MEEEPEKEEEEPAITGEVKFDAGSMTPEEINALLNTVPFDMTFVDKHDKVKCFTQGKERILPARKRHRQGCPPLPPARQCGVVEGILSDFKSGKKDTEVFWIRLGDKFVLIRYFAVRNAEGKYLGTLEVTQDIKPITKLKGEKRLVSK